MVKGENLIKAQMENMKIFIQAFVLAFFTMIIGFVEGKLSLNLLTLFMELSLISMILFFGYKYEELARSLDVE